jgi:hypothetical protein
MNERLHNRMVTLKKATRTSYFTVNNHPLIPFDENLFSYNSVVTCKITNHKSL